MQKTEKGHGYARNQHVYHDNELASTYSPDLVALVST